MAAWPASLPQNLEVGVKDVRQKGFVRTPMSAGPPKQRKRFSASSRELSGNMHFTAAQRATFETFYVTTINEGSDEFTFIDPNDGLTANFRFVDVPQLSGLKGGASGGDLWMISLKLERLPA